MKRINSCIITILLILPVYGQMKDFAYRRRINNITSTWQVIVIPDEVYKNVLSGMNEFRIYGFTSSSDTIEAPYIAASTLKDETSIDVPFELLNQSKKGDIYFYTFEVPVKNPINGIYLNFSELNFDYLVTLEGSQDQQKWYEILNNYRIISMSDDFMNYQFTILNFNRSKYKYLRMSFKSNTKPSFESAVLKSTSSELSRLTSYKSERIFIKNHPENKTTVIELTLKEKVPVSCVKVNVTDKTDYYRPLEIEYVSDSFVTEKGTSLVYTHLASGTLSSLEPGEFCFSPVIAQRFKITISNFDNQPLHAGNIEAKGPVYYLIARFTEKADYYLYYGKRTSTAPNYDIGLFRDNIPEHPDTLIPGNEEILNNKLSPEQNAESKKLLYGMMILIILVLGSFTLIMIRTTKRQKNE